MQFVSILFILALWVSGCSGTSSDDDGGDSCLVGSAISAVESQEVQAQEERVRGSAVDGEGRVVFVGQRCSGYPDCSVAVWRMTRQGALDTSFGTSGVALHDSSAGQNDEGLAAYVDAQNRMWVSGSSNGDLAVWRFTAEGDLDTSFATSGAYISDNPLGLGGGAAKTDFGIALVQASGSGVIVLNYTDFSGNYHGLIRIDDTGTKVNSWGTSGVQNISTLPGTSVPVLTDLVRHNDQLIAAGYDGTNLVIAKLSMGGSLLTGFDSDGVRTYAGGGGYVALESNQLRFNSAGEAFLVGKGIDSGSSTARTLVAKFDTDFLLDSGFGTSGIASLDRDGTLNNETGHDLIVENDRLYVLSQARNSGDTQSRGVVRVLDPSSGVVDATFGTILLEDTFGGGANRDYYEVFGAGCGVLHVAGHARNSAGTVTRGAFARMR